ncbi:hypothetical protein Afil01_26480 [Actinorhabdospora filicis]|uniref:Uncharacterized protein n=1 Tax=Actinorhabdospora filicis TaxID=1785913 RepID=A0A9W6W9R7_9ACTN|nr:hypothetical protein [Actinorhabdospora filicis]GLZ77841.1 hypothetical protein Afil01_26480 [Actinorhabdospora filicis]
MNPIGKAADWMLRLVAPKATANAFGVEFAGCCDFKICRFCNSGTPDCWCAGCSGPRCA